MYALVVAWCRRQNYRFQGRAQARPRWLTLAGGAGVLGLTLWLIFWLNPGAPGQKIRMAGILGVTEGEAWLASKTVSRAASLHLKEKAPGGQPAYALLHPESPPSLLPPAKPTAGNQMRKPMGQRPPALEANKPKGEPKLISKEKATGKVKAKKKTSRPSAKPSQSSQDNSG